MWVYGCNSAAGAGPLSRPLTRRRLPALASSAWPAHGCARRRCAGAAASGMRARRVKTGQRPGFSEAPQPGPEGRRTMRVYALLTRDACRARAMRRRYGAKCARRDSLARSASFLNGRGADGWLKKADQARLSAPSGAAYDVASSDLSKGSIDAVHQRHHLSVVEWPDRRSKITISSSAADVRPRKSRSAPGASRRRDLSHIGAASLRQTPLSMKSHTAASRARSSGHPDQFCGGYFSILPISPTEAKRPMCSMVYSIRVILDI